MTSETGCARAAGEGRDSGWSVKLKKRERKDKAGQQAVSLSRFEAREVVKITAVECCVVCLNSPLHV